ncbi:uncharacterized protein RCO7_14698 [Rhynchosporium graminicola]|uniref:Uncharacterized protein n=1 Tax=Rhynchosporium graminicola TaxID=2792576 RepID=A0A1E1KWK5_9HELO|nr:uncharacterized protein RCO7_14698 [Rhynchosporium commune]
MLTAKLSEKLKYVLKKWVTSGIRKVTCIRNMDQIIQFANIDMKNAPVLPEVSSPWAQPPAPPNPDQITNSNTH